MKKTEEDKAPDAFEAAPLRMTKNPTTAAAFHAWTQHCGGHQRKDISTEQAVALARQEERLRAARLLAAATESPELTHYQRLAALPPSMSGERQVPIGWGLATKKLAIMAGCLGAGIAIVHWGLDMLSRMMWGH